MLVVMLLSCDTIIWVRGSIRRVVVVVVLQIVGTQHATSANTDAIGGALRRRRLHRILTDSVGAISRIAVVVAAAAVGTAPPSLPLPTPQP